jgi:hypothetical protein
LLLYTPFQMFRCIFVFLPVILKETSETSMFRSPCCLPNNLNNCDLSPVLLSFMQFPLYTWNLLLISSCTADAHNFGCLYSEACIVMGHWGINSKVGARIVRWLVYCNSMAYKNTVTQQMCGHAPSSTHQHNEVWTKIQPISFISMKYELTFSSLSGWSTYTFHNFVWCLYG